MEFVQSVPLIWFIMEDKVALVPQEESYKAQPVWVSANPMNFSTAKETAILVATTK